MSKYQILKEYEQNLMQIEDLIGASITDNHKLDKLGSLLFGTNYIGTFSSDYFPHHIKNEQCFIMNNKSSRSVGEHFVPFYKKDGKLYGYDTFNRPVHSLSKYWANINIIDANTKRDQSWKEKDCGSRSMAFLLSFSKWGDKVIGII